MEDQKSSTNRSLAPAGSTAAADCDQIEGRAICSTVRLEQNLLLLTHKRNSLIESALSQESLPSDDI